MSEAQLSPSPAVTINLELNSNTGSENNDGRGEQSISSEPGSHHSEPDAIVVAAIVEQSGVPAIADEISGAVEQIAELVDGASTGSEPSGADGALQSGNDTERSSSASDNAVEIAGIVAERDVTIAAIDAETERARIAASAELELNEELELCKTRIALLETTLAEMQNLLIPPVLEEPTVEQVEPATQTELETVEETDLTHQSTPAPTAEIETVVSEVNADAEQVPATVENLRRKYIRI